MKRLVKTAALLFLCLPVLPQLMTAQQVTSTDFDFASVGGTAASRTITVSGVSSGDSFSLQFGNEFSIGNRTCSGNTCTLSVTFSPAYPGLRQGAIVATDTGGHLLATAVLYGVGVAPQIGFTPGVIQTVANRAAKDLENMQPSGIAIGNGANVFFSDIAHHVVWHLDTTTGRVNAYAGSGVQGYAGDGGSATAAQLNTPRGLAFDGAGNLYIVDSGNHAIRMVSGFSGVISTVVGNGSAGFSGDGGAATSAQLNGPGAVAVDGAGNLYISDTSNQRIREVNTAGTISTFAGNGTAGFSGDSGAATGAELNRPEGLALDAAGNLFIADVLNNRIRQVNTGGTITTVAGEGTAGSTGDGGAATSASLNMPWGVTVDAADNLYISDTASNLVRKVAGDVGHVISTFAGNGTAVYTGDGGVSINAGLSNPELLAIDGPANVYIVDRNNYAVRKVSATAAPLVVPNTAVGQTSSPAEFAVANTGNTSLSVTGLSASGNFGQQVSSNECSSSTNVAVGSVCTVVIAYNATSGAATTGTATVSSNTLNVSSAQSIVGLAESAGLRFVAITPCRVADTRGSAGPIVSGNSTRNFTITGGACGIPSTAQAFAMNVTVVPSTGYLGYLTVWPAGESRPVVSLLNSWDGRTKADAAIIPSGSGGAISVYATDNTQVVLDVSGYFVSEVTNPSDLEFYPLPPCRVADTRQSGGAFAATETRQFAVLTSGCNVPASAQAYSLNLTAVPPAPLSYITAWPAGQTQPVVSNLNAPTGAVTANAAIVQGGSGGNISIYASDTTQLVIDINGYFAPPATGGLSFYNLTPCRVFDTRTNNAQTLNPFSGTLNVNVPANSTATANGCNVPDAPIYVLNTTVYPSGGLGFLALWPQGQAQPLVSTLNASDDALTSNLALLPAINGSVSAYASSSTDLFMDISGYFAP